MGTHKHSMEYMQAEVKAYISKQKTIKIICADSGICRKTFYNWVELCKKKKKHLFIKNDSVTKKRQKSNQDILGKNTILKSAIVKIVPEELQRKMIQNIVRRFSVKVEDACEMVGLEFERYGYRPRVPEIDDQLVIDVIKNELAINPSTPLYNCYPAILTEYPDCPSKQMKRICKENKSAFKAYRESVKNRMRREEMIRLENEKVYRKSNSWVLFVQEFELSKRIKISEKRMTAQGTIMFLFDKKNDCLLNYYTIAGFIKRENIDLFFKECLERNGNPKELWMNLHPLNMKDYLFVKEEYNIQSIGILNDNAEGEIMIGKIKEMIEAAKLLYPKMRLIELRELCETWRRKMS